MAKFIVNRAFQFGGAVRRENSILEISDAEVKTEIARGDHPDFPGRPLSGLLNHCYPADDATAELVKDIIPTKEIEEAPTDEEKQAELLALRGEFDALGKAYHPGWTLGRLKKELVKAKKEAGAPKKKGR